MDLDEYHYRWSEIVESNLDPDTSRVKFAALARKALEWCRKQEIGTVDNLFLAQVLKDFREYYPACGVEVDRKSIALELATIYRQQAYHAFEEYAPLWASECMEAAMGLVESGEMEKAAGYAELAVDLFKKIDYSMPGIHNEHIAEAYLVLAYVKYCSEQYDDAIRITSMAFERFRQGTVDCDLDRHYRQCYILFGVTYIALLNYPLAVESFEKAISVIPESEEDGEFIPEEDPDALKCVQELLETARRNDLVMDRQRMKEAVLQYSLDI